MKILFVNMTPFYHNTSANIRMCGAIAGTSKNGHMVDLITMKADEDDYLYEFSKDEFLRKYVNKYYTFDKAEIYQKLKERNTDNRKQLFYGIKSLLKNLYRKIEIYDSQFINIKNILQVDTDFNKYDRIVSVSDPKSSNRLVYELIKKRKISNSKEKWIQYWGDPWLIDITKDYGWKKFLVKKEESKILSKAYKIVYASPITMLEQKKIYGKEQNKMFFVNQSARVSGDCTQLSNFDNYVKQNDKNELIGYIGAYSTMTRNIRPLYNCCVKNSFNLNIIGDGDKEIKSEGTVRVIKSIPQNEAEAVENSMDILVCLCNKKGTQIPGKIFYVAALNKPIIIIVDGERKKEIGEYLRSFRRYIICDNDDISIRNAIIEAKNERQAGKKYILSETFNDTYCAKKLLE